MAHNPESPAPIYNLWSIGIWYSYRPCTDFGLHSCGLSRVSNGLKYHRGQAPSVWWGIGDNGNLSCSDMFSLLVNDLVKYMSLSKKWKFHGISTKTKEFGPPIPIDLGGKSRLKVLSTSFTVVVSPAATQSRCGHWPYFTWFLFNSKRRCFSMFSWDCHCMSKFHGIWNHLKPTNQQLVGKKKLLKNSFGMLWKKTQFQVPC